MTAPERPAPEVPALGAAFGARLGRALAERGPLCVGLDPHRSLLQAWDLPDDPAGLERFARTVVDALAGQVAVIKPQSAFFERRGARGIAVLERCLADIRAGGALALLDAKRGDIGSTVEAYAAAYLEPDSPLHADAITASPYLGPGALRPLLETARRGGGGVFVLALTSNAEGQQVQLARTGQGTVAGTVLQAVAAANAAGVPPSRQAELGSFGVVIGATLPALPLDVAAALARMGGPVLAPGLGAQGATPADLARLFGAGGAPPPAVLPSASRDVLRAGPAPAALARAAAELNAQCRAALAAGDGGRTARDAR